MSLEIRGCPCGATLRTRWPHRLTRWHRKHAAHYAALLESWPHPPADVREALTIDLRDLRTTPAPRAYWMVRDETGPRPHRLVRDETGLEWFEKEVAE